MRYSVRLGALVVLPAAFGCADLAPMESFVCGNGAIDGDHGEECDGFVSSACGEGNIPCSCIPPGQPGQCRYACSADPAVDEPKCPPGYGCGTDGICRRAEAKFTSRESRMPVLDVSRIGFADFDGDETLDLIADSPWAVEVLFGEQDGGFGTAMRSQAYAVPVVVGDLSADRRSDLLLGDDDGLVVELGTEDQQLGPTIYASFLVGDTGGRLLITEAMPATMEDDTVGTAVAELSYAGDEVLFLVRIDGPPEAQTVLVDPQAALQIVGKLPVAIDPAQIAGEIVTADLRLESDLGVNAFDHGCEELVIAPEGEGQVYVHTPCWWDDDAVGGGAFAYNTNPDADGNPMVELPPVQLESGRLVTDGVLLAQLNDDDILDIVIGTRPASDGVPEDFMIAVAYGLGDGTFHSDPLALAICLPDPGMPCPNDNTAEVVDHPDLHEMPLAMGDVNNDGDVDIVLPRKILVSLPQSTAAPLFDETRRFYEHPVSASGWRWAVIDNFNADPFPDIIAASVDEPQLLFLNNASNGAVVTELFNEYWIPLPGAAASFAVGDFDGDLLRDVAFSLEDVLAAEPSDESGLSTELMVAFGNPYGVPTDPVRMGVLGSIKQLVSGNIGAGGVDAVSDLAVVTDEDGTDAVGVLRGSGERQLRSPFRFEYSYDSDGAGKSSAETYRPLSTAIGEFVATAEEPRHLDVAAVTLAEGRAYDRGCELGSGDYAGSPPPAMILWIVQSTGEARLAASDAVALPFPEELCWCEPPLVRAIDLDDDRVDEIAVLGSTSDGKGVLLLARRQGDESWSWMPFAGGSPTQQIDQAFLHVPYRAVCMSSVGKDIWGFDEGYDAWQSPVESQAFVRDLDADGRPELVASGLGYEDGEVRAESIVVFSVTEGGTLDAWPPIQPDLPEEAFEQGRWLGFAPIQLDDDTPVEIVVLTANAVYAGERGPDGGQLDLEPLHVLPEEVDMPGGLRIAVEDVDRDGVEDIVVGDRATATIFFGKPVIR